MAVPIRPSSGSLELGVAVPFFRAPSAFQVGRTYTVGGGGRFLFRVTPQDEIRTPLTVLLNWARTREK